MTPEGSRGRHHRGLETVSGSPHEAIAVYYSPAIASDMAGPQKAWMLRSIICVRLCRHTCFHRGIAVSVAWVASAGGADDSGDRPSWGLGVAVFESTIVDKCSNTSVSYVWLVQVARTTLVVWMIPVRQYGIPFYTHQGCMQAQLPLSRYPHGVNPSSLFI